MTILTKEMIDAFPVANLHVHLPGVISPETALELGLRNNLVRIENGKIVSDNFLANIPADVTYKKYSDIFLWDNDENGNIINLRYDIVSGLFNEFDQVMGIVQGHKFSYMEGGRLSPVGGIQTADDLTFVLDKYLENCLAGKVKYVELQQNIFLSQILFSHLDKRDAQREFFDVLQQAQEKFADAGVALYFVQCFNKSSGLETEDQAIARACIAVEDLLFAQECHPNLFIKLNSAGNEKHPLAQPIYQRAAYANARANGIALDCHAGEANHAQAVLDAVQHLGVEIIGHGFQIVESAMAKSFAAARDLIFFVCPAMNMFLGANLNMPDGKVEVQTLWQHPFFEMLREKVDGKYLKVALATDNPSLGGLPFKEMLMQLAGLLPEITGYPPEGTPTLSGEELYRCAKNGIDAIPSMAERMRYQQQLDSWAKLSKLDVGLPQDISPDR